MTDPDPPAIFAEPRAVASIDDCYFYHTTDVPGVGVRTGEWDLRPGIRAYLGDVPFAGKRVLDLGAASGFLSFHMEQQGADVVSFDLSERHPWDIVPFSGLDIAEVDRVRRAHLRRINDAYWFCHGARGSRARVAYGTVYGVPDGIGPVDIAVVGSILLHLRDPFLALWNAVRLARETAIVTDIIPHRYRWTRFLGARFGLSAKFLPRAARREPFDAWWYLSPETVREFLRVLGFADATVTFHRQLFLGEPRQMFTIVARRTGPTLPLPGE